MHGVFGIEKGWAEINTGADIKVPLFFKFFIKYVSPLFLIIVFVGAIPDIIANATKETSTYGWVGRIMLISLFIVIALFVYIAKKRNNPLYVNKITHENSSPLD